MQHMPNNPRTNSQSTSLADSFKHAGAGIAYSFRTQRNMRIHACFAAAALVLGFICGISFDQWLIVLCCIGMVFGLECVNTALECAIDLVAPEYHDLAKHAKDAAAGGVLCAAIASLAIGIALFAPALLSFAGIAL